MILEEVMCVVDENGCNDSNNYNFVFYCRELSLSPSLVKWRFYLDIK